MKAQQALKPDMSVPEFGMLSTKIFTDRFMDLCWQTYLLVKVLQRSNPTSR